MKRKYRLLMNRNGEFVVQRKFGFLWYCWGKEYGHIRWCKGWCKKSSISHCATLYKDSETACKGLLEAQEHDDNLVRHHSWTTVIKEAKGL